MPDLTELKSAGLPWKLEVTLLPVEGQRVMSVADGMEQVALVPSAITHRKYNGVARRRVRSAASCKRRSGSASSGRRLDGAGP